MYLVLRTAHSHRPHEEMWRPVHGDDADVGHFAYPCERSQAIRRVPSSHSSTSALLFNPLMYWVSVPGHSATIRQSSSAIRSILKVTRGDFFMSPIWSCSAPSTIPNID